MYQYIYLSKAKNNITSQEIEGILSQAHVNNPKRGITGVLIYANGYFIQVIEGHRENVDTLMENISQDQRSEGVLVLANHAIEKRMFADWSMGYIKDIPKEVRHMMGFDFFRSLDEIEAHLEKKDDWVSEFLRSAVNNLNNPES